MNTLMFFILALCSISSKPFIDATKSQIGFSVDLIHIDSPMSPFYNPSISQFDLIRNAALHSNSRLNKFSLPLLLNDDENDSSHESIIIPNSGTYLLRIFIGTPPIEKLVVFDTGSDLTWVQCSPCINCFTQDTPFYDRNKSSTFSNVPCDSHFCSLLPTKQQFCEKSQECLYQYSYGDKSLSIGELVVDSISFGSNSGGYVANVNANFNADINNINFPKSIFGCGYYNIFTANISGKTTGLAGLGAGPLSLVSQLGDFIEWKFSYCLVSFYSNATSKLKFGKEAIIKGDGVVSTPLIIKSSQPTFYHLNLEGISVEHKTVLTGRSDGNMIIDSGSTLTYLDQPFFDDFITSVKEVVGIDEVEEIPPPFHYCLKYQPEMMFPSIVLHFTGANVSMLPQNMLLLEENKMVCLAVVPSFIIGTSILGNMAQIDFQVEYDLEGKKISFAPSNCSEN